MNKNSNNTIKWIVLTIVLVTVIIGGSFVSGTFYPNSWTVEKIEDEFHEKELSQVQMLGLTEPEFEYTDKPTFLTSTKKCVEYLNYTTDRMSRVPTSIIIAMAGIESGWGTSRFYKEANNVFGVWSYSENESRIKAMEDREGKSVYVKKYDALPKSIVSYFKTIARGPYSEFRAAREKISEVSVLISYLEVYSELREEYVKRLDQLIQYNKLEKYDSYRLK